MWIGIGTPGGGGPHIDKAQHSPLRPLIGPTLMAWAVPPKHSGTTSLIWRMTPYGICVGPVVSTGMCLSPLWPSLLDVGHLLKVTSGLTTSMCVPGFYYGPGSGGGRHRC